LRLRGFRSAGNIKEFLAASLLRGLPRLNCSRRLTEKIIIEQFLSHRVSNRFLRFVDGTPAAT